ncbi:hypothetical protein BBK36DRAFT_1161533 [Trichoderma citrinoviride]|uniref:Mid2 domain-containing protein n=1 Tax=Trichoderma citrinoviride TaxID=58853 RepID=A0A2T4B578_9HYPO|nr:hypothetical protein BBK36DRAFT_1161533 [Trichoderma citrinoviride]PTB64482.1 hypothetical protein BBK36DRAFT_1161533 [Trichoderma citrinoviride]
MHHIPKTSLLLLLLGAAASIAQADNNKPLPKSGLHESWASPARETVAAAGHEADQQLALGWSPRPTQAPKPLLGRMMVPRADDFTLGPQTCGFVPGTAGNSFTCISSGFTCTPQQGHVGCCEPNSACSLIKTTCIDYKASQGGACNLPSDYHTLCCGTSSLPACYTWVVSTSAASDDATSLYTLLDCSPQAGRGTLLTIDPGWSSTHSFGPTTTTTSTTSSASSTTSTSTSSTTATPEPAGKKKSSTPVAAIAGGTVGGVAAFGLVGLAAFLFVRRHKKTGNAPSNAAAGGTPPQDNQNSAAPGGGAVYPSGVPAGYAPVPMHQQGYDAQQHMGQYGQQGGVYPQQYHQGQYPPQQQQYNYPVEVNGSTPGAFKEGEVLPQQQSPPPTELAAVSPVGAETNRAELGS